MSDKVTLVGIKVAGTPDDVEGIYLHLEFSNGTWACQCPINTSKEEALEVFESFIDLIKQYRTKTSQFH